MNIKLEGFKKNIKGKKTAVIGIGVSNTIVTRFLISSGAEVTAFDKKTKEQLGESYDVLNDLGCRFSLGENYLANLACGFDYVFRTPGMRFDIPEIVEAKKNGAQITSEMELLFELCPCKIFGVTGSDGKTTTTSLINLMLKESGYKTWLGGNIGTPLLDKVKEMNENDMVVVEMSSFQLQTFKQSPNISVITNLSPNHLDYHKNMEEYIDAKKNIFRFQQKDERLILNFDNEITKRLALEANSNVTFFSRLNKLDKGVFADNDSIFIKTENDVTEIMKISDIKLPGIHNIENYLAAIAATYEYVNVKNIKIIANTFTGVEHRIEFVRELQGVKFYNDSIASSPSRTRAGLNSFNQKVILIAGGYDKKIPFDELGKDIAQRVKSLYLIGITADKIEAAVRVVDKNFPIIKCISLEETVNLAFSNASHDDIIIMSPACASFDMYKNFEERGNAFKRIVNNL